MALKIGKIYMGVEADLFPKKIRDIYPSIYNVKGYYVLVKRGRRWKHFAKIKILRRIKNLSFRNHVIMYEGIQVAKGINEE